MSDQPLAWAYVAHKGNRFRGAMSGLYPSPVLAAEWRADVSKFCGKFVMAGCTITPVQSRDEYDALTKPMFAKGLSP